MKTMLFVVTILCVAYFILMSIRFKVPESISATYYLLGKYGWIFQATLYLIVILLMPVWINVSEDMYQPFCFLACSSLMFVATAPSFRLSMLEWKVHCGAAIICCVCSVIWQIVEGLWDIVIFVGFFSVILSLQWREKWCWWLEVAVVISLLSNLWRVI